MLNFTNLALERIEKKAATDHLKNIEDFLSDEQNDPGRVIASLHFAERDVPTHDNVIPVLRGNCVVRCQPFSLDDRAAGWDRALLVLRRESDRTHAALEIEQHIAWFMFRMQKLAF